MHKLSQSRASLITQNCVTATSASLERKYRQSNYGAAFAKSLSWRPAGAVLFLFQVCQEKIPTEELSKIRKSSW